MSISKKKKLRHVEPSDRGFEVVELIKENGEDFALVKIKLEDVSKLKILRTDEKRRQYQMKAQREYRKRLASKQSE